MLAEVRMEVILAELDKEQAVSVAHLCQVTGASEATIRRDLNELARRGKLNKVHGGGYGASCRSHSSGDLGIRQLQCGQCG